MTQEEIQKRIKTAQARQKERMAPVLQKKEEDRKLSKRMNEEGIILAYLDTYYCKQRSCSASTIELRTKVSIAAKREESQIEGKTKLVMAYAILSEHDNFNKAFARKLLDTRLKDINAKQRVTIEVTEKAVDNSEKMHDIIRKAFELELASNTDTVPAWLYAGIQLREEVYGTTDDL